LSLFDTNNKFRFALFKNQDHPIFSNVILACILLSTLTLTFENPLNDPDSSYSHALFYIDILFTVIFTVEAATKIIAYGFVFNGSESYLKDYWNVLDFVIVLLAIS
jgi:voltage-dependent calcium channel L type alpha-1S